MVSFLKMCASKIISTVNVILLLICNTTERIFEAKLDCLALSGLSNWAAKDMIDKIIARLMNAMIDNTTIYRVKL